MGYKSTVCSINAEDYLIEGVSIAGEETCVVVPKIKSTFDIGRCLSQTLQTNFLFITHAHLDHINGLPVYLKGRSKPPTVFIPPCIKQKVEKLLDLQRSMSDAELNLNLVALEIGETYELGQNYVVRAFPTYHDVPSQGYVVYSAKKKLKEMYLGLQGREIAEIKKSGAEVTETVLCPEVAFTGDTRSDFYLDPRNSDALRAKVLITEATFLDEDVSVEEARRKGHTHLSEIMEHAELIKNKTLVLGHFSTRYKIEDIQTAAMKLQGNVSANVVALTEGFVPKHEEKQEL